MVLVVKCLICQKELTYSHENPFELIKHMKIDHQFERKSKENSLAKEKIEQIVETSFVENSKNLKKLIDKSAQTEFGSMATNKGHRETESFEYVDALTHQNKHKTQRISDETGSHKSLSTDMRLSHLQKIQDAQISENNKKLHHPTTSRNAAVDDESHDERQRLLKDKRQSRKYYKTSIERWRPVGDSKISCPRCHSHSRPTVRTQRQHVTSSSLASSFLMTCWPLCFSPCYLPEPKYENLFCPVCNFHLGVFDHQKKNVIPNPKLMQQ